MACGAGGSTSQEQALSMPFAPTTASQPHNQQQQLAYVQQALLEQPENALVWYRKAKLHHEMAQPQQAIEAINKALALDSTQENYYLLKAQALGTANQNAAALTAARKAEARNGLTPMLAQTFIDLYLNEGQDQLALDYAGKMISLDGQSHEAYLMRAQLRLDINDTAGASADLYNALRLAPGLTAAYQLQYSLALARQQPASALTWLNKALQVQAVPDTAWLQVANLHQQLGQPDSAVLALKTLQKHPAQQLSATLALSQLWAQQKRFDSARHYANQALQQDSLNLTAHLNSARLYTQRYRYNAAINAYNLALRIDSTSQLVLTEKADVQRKLAYLRNLRAQQDSAANNNQ